MVALTKNPACADLCLFHISRQFNDWFTGEIKNLEPELNFNTQI